MVVGGKKGRSDPPGLRGLNAGGPGRRGRSNKLAALFLNFFH